jgi:hypothetical protein
MRDGTRRKKKMPRKQMLGMDNWLHILSSAIANYAEEGGEIVIGCRPEFEGPDVIVVLTGVDVSDPRLHPDFKKLWGLVAQED